MQSCLETLIALAQMSPGAEENFAEIEEARRLLAAQDEVLSASRALLAGWEKGNLSEAIQRLDRAVSAPVLPKGTNLIRNFLDLSTGHLDQASRQALESRKDGLVSYELEYGWLIYVSDPDTVKERKIPAVLEAILDRARSLGCDYVLLDGDAAYDEELPSFDDTETPTA
ncbi:hypothetical protein [Azospirillum sp. SYSU D00513]|uniref:DUF5983 family protein n=1 Tax=Azospirillum sp. SYSU D00513 TaxID=2812561 RepID=UPI001A9790CA|nr:hypothetical protein [Azospirillum sp. SYSU D00513]